MIRSISVIFTISTSRLYCVSSQTFAPPPGVPRCMAARISYFSLYRAAGFSSIPLLRHQHINPVRRSNSLTHPQDQSGVLQLPQGPLAGLRTAAPAPRPAPQREIGGVQFWVWERRGLSAAPWCDVAIFDLDTKLFFEVSQIIRIILLVFQAAIVYSQYFNRRRSFVAPISIISHLVGLMSIIPCNTIMTFIPFLF